MVRTTVPRFASGAAGLLALLFSASAGAQQVVVREGDVWDFFRGRVAPPADWAAPDFVPGDWEQGPTGIGYSDGDDATVLDDMANGYMAVFLRIGFEVPEGAAGWIPSLSVRYDDGFVAYIDGKEVARRGLAGDPPAFDAAADDHEITVVQGFDETIVLDLPSGLPAGSHVLAAEVHNKAIDSSDLSFSAELSLRPFLVTGVQPATGPMDGGTPVTVSGSGFSSDDALQVLFGGKPATSVTVAGSTSMLAVTPAGAAGTVAVEVRDSRGSFVLPDAFTYTEPGITALAFDGGDRADAAPFASAVPAGTVELWFRRATDTRNQWRTLLSFGTPAGAELFRLDVRNDRLRARTGSGTNVQTLTATSTFAVDAWHHVAATFGPEGRGLFLDGVPAISDANAMSVPAGSRLRVGGAFATATSFLGGISGVRLWASERAPEEIARLRFARLDASAGVLASWPLDDGAGQGAADLGPGRADLVLGDTAGTETTDPGWATFTDFPAFAVTGMSPSTGPLGGGGTADIFGAGFGGDTPPEVLFGTNPSPSVEVVSDWQLRAQVPAGAAFDSVDVTVRTAGGSSSLPKAYLYAPDEVHYLVREGDVWDYLPGRSPPPADWKDLDLLPGEADWEAGPTGIGYSDDDDATVLPDMQNSYWSVYARRTFELPASGAGILYLRLRVRYDDGYIAYLNGEEIARANLDGAPPAYDAAAATAHEITGGTGHFDEEVDVLSHRDLLRAGRNVLAIEVHNATIDSSDLSLSAELVFWAPGKPFIRGDVDGSGRLNLTDPISLLAHLLGGRSVPCEEACDVNGDGKVDVVDPIMLLRYLFADGEQPAAPFPEAALDVDGDDQDCKA